MTARTISKICSVEGCRKSVSKRGYCGTHYMRVVRTGSTFYQPPPSTWQELLPLFWERVAIKTSRSDCWEWKKWKDEDGYGHAYFQKKRYASHRIAFFYARGRWPEGVTRHTCDNPPCCNPEHLVDGTPADNSRDMSERGRSARGEKNAQSVLTEIQVKEIRRRVVNFPKGKGRGSANSKKALSQEFGVTRSVILGIVTNRLWRHVK